MIKGFIYGYKENDTWVYVGQSKNIQRRHRRHFKETTAFCNALKANPENFTGPFVLDTVVGCNDKDFAFNACFQETVWMFKLKTIRAYFKTGYNICLPYICDYAKVGRAGGLIGGSKGGKNGFHEDKVKNGRLGGLIGGKLQPHEAKVRGGRKGGKLGSINQSRKYKIIGGIKGAHIVWHKNRNKFSKNCKLCRQEKLNARNQ
jgi:GIY-YIG catalytic domain